MTEITGSSEERRAEAERLVQEIVSTAKCEIWDYEHRIRCGLVDADGEKKEFSLLLNELDTEVLRAHAKSLKARLR